MCFLDFRRKFIEKRFNRRKKVENGCKKYFDQLSGLRSNQKLVIIHNKWGILILDFQILKSFENWTF